MNKNNIGKILLKAIKCIILVGIILFTIYPLIWMVSGSLKGTQEFYTNIWNLPETWKWVNYSDAWKRAGLAKKYINSIVITAATLLIVIPVVGCAAYAIARTNFRFKKAVYTYLLLGLCIPSGVLAIPIFSAALNFGLVDKLSGMILFGAAQCMAFGTFLLRSFFISLPKSLEEAAMIDGCTRFQSFLKVILPLAKPGVMALVVLDGITVWNEYLLANVLLRSDRNMTLPLGMKVFVDKYVTDYPQLFAGLVMVTIPMLIVYIFAQRSFIEGMTAGSVKQ
ncbi:MAG: carbohydrate ABC transporter permease [Clostridia bacterium]|nr:carbohydrate ABC transporter permease [Clostridia bacterium]